MRADLRLVLSALLPACAAVLGAWCLAWPGWREGTQLFTDAEILERRAASFGEQAEALERLALRVSESRRRESLQTKAIPAAPEVHDLMRSLTTDVDGKVILDQTITAGKATPAVTGHTLPFEAMPLTIDMTARFEAIFDVVRRAEQMGRLVRVGSLRLSRPSEERNDKSELDPLEADHVIATIGLDAIYEAPISPGAPSPAPARGGSR